MGHQAAVRTTFNMAVNIASSLFLVLSIFFVFSSISEVRAVARVAARDLNLTFEMGNDATLTCTVRNIGKNRVIWRKLSDPFPLTVGTTKFWPGSKYLVQRQGDDWRLIIKKLQYADAGEYECRLSGDEDVAEILSLIIPGAGRTHLLPTETVVSTELGGTVTLPCHVKNLRKSIVLWQSQDGQVLSLRKKIYSSDKKHYKVLHTTKEEWSLEVSDVRQKDLGVYRCVINTDPFLTRTVTLTEGKSGIKIPETGQSTGGNPQLVLETFRKEAEANQYDDLTLRCQFTGDPIPKIRWERQIWDTYGNKVVEDLKTEGEAYTLTFAQPADTGLYICRATNGLPPPEYGRIQVKIHEKRTTTPEPTTTTMFNPRDQAAPQVFPFEKKVVQQYGRDVEMECRAVGVPRPQVHWTLNGRAIVNDFKHELRSEQFQHHTTLAWLKIRSVGPHNMGGYNCYAFNQHGDASAIIELATS